MICILLILIIIAVIVYYCFTDFYSIVPIIVFCLFVVVIATCVVFIIASCFSTVDEYDIYYDSYSISFNNFGESGVIYYYLDDQLLKISANTIDEFVGDTIGKFVIQERRFDSPDWFWLIAFIPDDLLLRTDVLIV